MAKVTFKKLKKIEKERNNVHDEVISTYSVYSINGTKYFQLDTYGKITREFTEKISQSFQIDRVDAVLIIELLKREFDIR